MKSGSSAFIGSGSHSADAFSTVSWYQTSRPSFIATSPPVRFTTNTVSTMPDFSIAASAFFFSGIFLAPR